jgi:DUF2971 family protein
MAVLAEDTTQYNDLVISQIKELGCLAYEPETIVWHYTTGRGLLGIIESGTIYATQVACLNDSTEIRYALRLYHDALVLLQEKNIADADAHRFLGKVIETFADDPALPSHAPSRFFVACFSRLEDDLNQWRVYSETGGENGYAIGFRARGLAEPNGALLRVNYDKAKHKEVADTVAEATLRFYKDGLQKQRAATPDQWMTEFLAQWDELIGRLAPLVKDECFAAEDEFRLVHELNVTEMHAIRFQQKETLLSRHLPLSFPVWMQVRYPMLPIAKVTVGPAKQQHISRISVTALLRQMGYGEIPVEISRRPLQRP